MPGNDPNDEYEGLFRRADRAFGGSSIEKAWTRRRAIVGPANMPAGDHYELAEAALETLRRGDKPTPCQLAALEAAIRILRPVPLSRGARLEDIPSEAVPVFGYWNTFRDTISQYLYSVARIDRLTTEGAKPVGTGFLVAERLLITNRHVLDMLSLGTRELEQGQAEVRFREEYGSPTEAAVAIVGVRAWHSKLDLALLELQDGEPARRSALPVEESEVPVGATIAALGYPLSDPLRNPLFVTALFDGRFAVKRAAPGEVTRTRGTDLYHDCSTLGGNSGSPVVSLETGRIVGVHQDGFFLYRNSAVPAAGLAEFIQQYR